MMDLKTFKEWGYAMIDYIADYMDTVDSREPLPSVEPNYLRHMMPNTAPEQGCTWQEIMKDLERFVMKGMTHWQNKHFHAYFSNSNSRPSVLASLLMDGLEVLAPTWISCPAATELEIIMLDWAAKFLDLPKFFLSKFSNPKSNGGGVIASSASEAILNSMIAAREHAIKQLRLKYPNTRRAVLLNKLVGYCSSQCHSCVEKAALIAHVRCIQLEVSEDGSLQAETLEKHIEADIEKGLVPFYHCSIFGSTGTCAFDNVSEIGPVCNKYKIHLHIDGAYGANCFGLPEMRYLKTGAEYIDSMNCNCNKWMLTTFDCSLHWVKDRNKLIDAFSGNDPSAHSDTAITDLGNWGITKDRKFRALKLWFVFRLYGLKQIRKYQRNHIKLAKLMENRIMSDPRFEIIGNTRVGLCCFRLKASNELNTQLLEVINTSRKIHMVPTAFHDKYVIRFATCNEFLKSEDIDYAWKIISEYATVIIHLFEKMKLEPSATLHEHQLQVDRKRRMSKEEEEPLLQMAARVHERRVTHHEEDIIRKASFISELMTPIEELEHLLSGENTPVQPEYDLFLSGSSADIYYTNDPKDPTDDTTTAPK